MRSFNAPVTLKLVFSLCWFMALAMIKNADAGDYFTYRDSKGNLVLSNSFPPAGSQVIKRETLPEVSDQKIAESRARDEKVGFDNKIANLEKTIDHLSHNLQAQSEVIDSWRKDDSDSNVAVGVTQGPAIGARPLREDPPRNFRNNFRSAQPRGTMPAPAPQQRLGGRARS
jgi:hypothetical protein